MSLSQMAKKVEAARAAWVLILDRDKRYEEGRNGTKLLLKPPLADHFMILPLVFLQARRAGFDPKDIIDQFGIGKLVEWGITYGLPPRLQEHAWLSLAGLIGAYDPGRDPQLRAMLGAGWEQRLLEELPAAVRLAFNESSPGEQIAPDITSKGRSIASRTKRLLIKTGDEVADKPKRVTSKRLEPGEMELALFAQQEAQGTSLAPEEGFFAYLSGLKPHQGETFRVVVDTANIPIAQWLDDAKAKAPFTKQEARVFDLCRKTSDRREVARRLDIKPESVTRIKNRIKRKVEGYPPAA